MFKIYNLKSDIIYFDNNATTQVDKEVLETMLPFLTSNFANANSTHLFGVDVNNSVKNARKQTAAIIGAEPHEITFTSGATEAINIAIKGVAENYSYKGKHIITLNTEHKAVLDTCKYLETKGFEITYLNVEKNGLINLDNIRTAIRKDTILVCIMFANNEIGVIQPIKEIAAITHQMEAIFMTDATQAIGKVKVDVDKMDIDILCFSGHKIYAPKGIGALFVRQRNNKIKIPALLHGGGHERGVRSGTLNVPGIVALGKACEIAENDFVKNNSHIENIRDYFETNILKIENTSINGDTQNRLNNTSNVYFKDVDSEALIMGLSNSSHLIAVSNGSACTASDIAPSHVLISLGLDETQAFSCIRFSFGKYNTLEEVDIVIEELKKIVNNLRAMIL